MAIITSAIIGENSDLIPKIMELYVPEGSVIIDVTYGKGVFWKNIDLSKYKFIGTDLQFGIDFRKLPYQNSSVDCFVLDPPYMHGGETIKPSINRCYHNKNTSHESVIRLYLGGALEASRVLKKGGKFLIKCQDEIESGKQMLSHIELINIITLIGFKVIDLFVLLQKTVPAMRLEYQKSARKNHSYMVIFEFRR